MLIKNTLQRYGLVSILFHWSIALLIIGMLGVGLYMADLPVGLEKIKLYGVHKETGMLILGLVIFRLAWHLSNRVPALPNTMPIWEMLAARSAHWALYLFMFAMPLTGWLLSSAAGFPVSFFGLFVIPTIIPPSKPLLALFGTLHYWLGYALIATIIGHAGAALMHHFVRKDDVLKRMWF